MDTIRFLVYLGAGIVALWLAGFLLSHAWHTARYWLIKKFGK